MTPPYCDSIKYVVNRAFDEKQQWQRLWSTMIYSLQCTGFLPPVYITRSALQAVVGDTEGCVMEAVQWIESCDQDQLYNQEDKVRNLCHHWLSGLHFTKEITTSSKVLYISWEELYSIQNFKNPFFLNIFTCYLNISLAFRWNMNYPHLKIWS